MNHIIETTEDGSNTLFVNNLNETYHSVHGALNESRHVFIKNGLEKVNCCDINILELGLGTGLNVLVTLDEFIRNQKFQSIHFFTLEKYPLDWTEASQLNYPQLFEDPIIAGTYPVIHQSEWNETIELTNDFYLKKIQTDFLKLENIELPEIDLVYFDCFGAQVQPDLWEMPLLTMVANKMKKGGLFTTYSSKGSLRRNLKSLNFDVEKVEGPTGKREMTNAWKL